MKKRLIYTDELETAIRDYADIVGPEHGEYALANGILKALSAVNNVPTAYDVEAVIMEIENIRNDESIRYADQVANACANAVRAGGGA